MKRRSVLSSVLLFPLARFASAFQRKRASPHETVSVDLGSNKISIVYGRPYLKGRNLGELTADGKVWRLGADEATKITVTGATKLGTGPELKPGSYSLFAITSPTKWTIIVNKTADQWGAFSYEESQDLGRFEVPVTKPIAPFEEFTIALTKKSESAAELSMAWGDESVSMPVRVS